MTSDAPETPKKGSATDSTSSSPGNAGGTGKAWVVGEPSSADLNPENSQQDVESLPIVEIRYPRGIEDDARAYKRREQRRDRWKVFLEALIVVGVLGYGAIAYRQWHTMLAASDNSTKALETTERAYVTALQKIVQPETVLRGVVTDGQRFGDINHVVTGEVGVRGSSSPPSDYTDSP